MALASELMPSPYIYQSGAGGGGSSSSQDSSYELTNLSIATSVGSSALTIALKDKSGDDPSAGSPVKIAFRSATAATGTYVQRTVSSALSVVVSSGSTLGMTSGNPAYLNVYALDNAGTVELAVVNGFVDEGQLQSTTAEGGAGAADSSNVLYSTTARTSKAVRWIGRILITEATAGTWASNATEVSPTPFLYPSLLRTSIYTSGSGNHVMLANTKYARVRMVGGGGGGGGGGSTDGTAATAGGNTTFGTSLLTANGGGAGARSVNTGTSGGSYTVNAPAIDVASTQGGVGEASQQNAASGATFPRGGTGGGTPFGSGMPGSYATGAIASPPANTGAGGGGGGTQTTGASLLAGAGGGAGGYVEAILPSASGTYSYAVGAGGSGQAAGTNGGGGTAGSAGRIIVEEYG